MGIINKIQGSFKVIFLTGILIFINVLGSFFFGSVDLTEEKRFTLTPSTKNIIRNVPEVVLVRVLLEGEFPAGFKRLQQSTKELLDQFRAESGYIEYQFEDPNDGSIQEINARREELKKDGLVPTNLMVRTGTENKEQLIYPYAIFNFAQKKIAINLLEHSADQDQETNLSNSISLLEYKFANALQKLQHQEKKNILLSTGHGELEKEQTKALVLQLSSFYNVGYINLDSNYNLKKEIDLLIIARPTIPFSEKNKFALDQYLMNGGKIIYLVDGMSISLDTLSTRTEYIPEPLDVNLSDLFFEYGLRIEPNLVLDLECSRIPQVIGNQGGKPQIELFPWYYHPLVASKSTHPIVNNIDRISLEFPSSIDTLKTKTSLKKTVLIQSSQYSRYQLSPMKVGFDILRYKADPDKFNKPFLPIGVLVEGEFSSLFENRVSEELKSQLTSLGMDYKSKSSPTSILLVSDGDLIRNLYDKETGKFAPLGYNKWEKTSFNGNKDFILNSIEYMIAPDNVLSARAKEIKLRMLDKVKAEKEKGKWQFFNIGLPVILLIIFGLLNQFIRRKKYIKPLNI
ncbi:MAG: gliding motility-associated ABC transporter substrate-binding protein GldG [Saprospiraceae bacterium]|nr:gliding motility-associated ABC transporter substrate-binding protein GldG [Candidatus Vicinibacter affinis]